ncbi:MAG: hypothetical protein WA906_02415 [Pacificimonas sp.]
MSRPTTRPDSEHPGSVTPREEVRDEKNAREEKTYEDIPKEEGKTGQPVPSKDGI